LDNAKVIGTARGGKKKKLDAQASVVGTGSIRQDHTSLKS